jgi:hypothetical protein
MYRLLLNSTRTCWTRAMVKASRRQQNVHRTSRHSITGPEGATTHDFLDRRVAFSNDNFFQDYWFYLRNNHRLLSCFTLHKNNPIRPAHRVCMFFCALFFSFSILAFFQLFFDPSYCDQYTSCYGCTGDADAIALGGPFVYTGSRPIIFGNVVPDFVYIYTRYFVVGQWCIWCSGKFPYNPYSVPLADPHSSNRSPAAVLPYAPWQLTSTYGLHGSACTSYTDTKIASAHSDPLAEMCFSLDKFIGAPTFLSIDSRVQNETLQGYHNGTLPYVGIRDAAACGYVPDQARYTFAFNFTKNPNNVTNVSDVLQLMDPYYHPDIVELYHNIALSLAALLTSVFTIFLVTVSRCSCAYGDVETGYEEIQFCCCKFASWLSLIIVFSFSIAFLLMGDVYINLSTVRTSSFVRNLALTQVMSLGMEVVTLFPLFVLAYLQNISMCERYPVCCQGQTFQRYNNSASTRRATATSKHRMTGSVDEVDQSSQSSNDKSCEERCRNEWCCPCFTTWTVIERYLILPMAFGVAAVITYVEPVCTCCQDARANRKKHASSGWTDTRMVRMGPSVSALASSPSSLSSSSSSSSSLMPPSSSFRGIPSSSSLSHIKAGRSDSLVPTPSFQDFLMKSAESEGTEEKFLSKFDKKTIDEFEYPYFGPYANRHESGVDVRKMTRDIP